MPRHTTSDQKPVFAGIDFHKKFSVITLGDADGRYVLHRKLENDKAQIVAFFECYGPLICAVENCRGTEWFIDLLKQLGNDVRVCNTFAVRLIADSRCKTDKIDSKILMELLAKDFLPTIYQPRKADRLMKERLRWRTHLVGSRTQYRNRTHSLLDKEHKGARLTSLSAVRRIQNELPLSSERLDILDEHLTVLEFFEGIVAVEDRWTALAAAGNPDVLRLKTVPGFGDICALAFHAEIGDVTRFRTARQVSKYFGLVPRVHSSAETTYRGGITKQGSKFMRWILVQCSWGAIRQSSFLLQKYSTICKKKGKQVAIVAIARTLAEIAFTVLRDGGCYDETRLTKG